MPDLDHLDALDRAFDALTRDLAHSPRPGAGAVVATARRRRRTRAGAVALAALVVVGGGLTVPRVLLADGGVAADGGAAVLDASALDRATAGWIGDWEEFGRFSTKLGGGFTQPECVSQEADRTGRAPQVGGGLSKFLGDQYASASALFAQYPDDAAARTDQVAAYATCPGAGTIEVDGVEVRHFALPGGEVGETSVTDVWTAQIGSERLTLEIASRAGVAPAESAGLVAEAVVAGLRAGESQETWDDDTDASAPDLPPALPPVTDSDLTVALAGWRAASPGSATEEPDIPCLAAGLSTGAASSSGSGTPRSVGWTIAGFDDDTTARQRVADRVRQLEGCADPRMTVRRLAHGVTLATFDAGGAAGDGAVWLHAVEDRAIIVGVTRADRPMPDGVADDVAEVIDGWLRLPWR